MKHIVACSCLAAVAVAAWMSSAGDHAKEAAWTTVAPGVLRSPGVPAGYALVNGAAAILVDAPHDAAGLAQHGVKTIEAVYLTDYHRWTVAAVAGHLKNGVPVHAPEKAVEWLSKEGVAKYWRESLPLRNSRTAYLVVAEGFDGIRYDLKDGAKISWRSWDLEVLDTPGHARAQVSILAKRKDSPRVAFVGGALASSGKLWAPYTTDWDHWTDAGLEPTAKSLRKIAERQPDIVCPAHGPAIPKNAVEALTQTADAVAEAGFMKSFERFTKQRLGNNPSYKFLTPEQAQSNGSKPWSRVSEHLWVTGNTYVLVSRDNRCLLIDPWDKRSVDQFAKLQKDQKLGPLEVVWFSHAHYDHYDGIYYLPDRNSFEVWSLDQVALPLAQPYLLRAPFLDARPVKFDRLPKDGESLAWREYRFKFHHFPGQSEFTMGVETNIDGKKCFFTADNFFHQDMFSGSGGWMGLNRSFPSIYASSAQKVLDAAPDWVLAEHGGPFEFNAEDFRRRVAWGKAAAQACDAVCLSGKHVQDWNPHRVHVEPLVQEAKAGDKLTWTLRAYNPTDQAETLQAALQGRGVIADQQFTLNVPAGGETKIGFNVALPANLAPGRHIFVVRVSSGARLDGSDCFLGADISGK